MGQGAKLPLFQQEKLKYYFNFFGPNEEGYLDKKSLENFMKRVRDFTRWNPTDSKYLHCYEIHENFFEILLDQSNEEGRKKDVFSLDQWFDMWAKILPGCMGMANFPVWLRLLPKTLFEMMDRNLDGQVGEDELMTFYREMVLIPESEVDSLAHEAYTQMTDGGRWPLNLESYEQVFANFLIGQTPYGPGRHIFGCFEHTVKKFQLIQPAKDDDETLGRHIEKAAEKVAVHYEKPRPFRQNSRGNLFG